MTPVTRKLVLVILLALLVGALGLYVLEGPTWRGLGMALVLILIWTPVKGLVYRRLEASRPYESALAANASSELAGLPFHLALSFWPLMGVSFLVSASIETLAIAAMGTASSWRRCLFLAFYGSLVVHLMTAGWFASQRSLALGIPFVLAGILLFHLPAMK
ncbi:MAG TPA: hypothetical protein VJ921_05215 [Vicinamibacteria bacterium]|nr:hypothetical protein [Vicinamibacteria bacterium]